MVAAVPLSRPKKLSQQQPTEASGAFIHIYIHTHIHPAPLARSLSLTLLLLQHVCVCVCCLCACHINFWLVCVRRLIMCAGVRASLSLYMYINVGVCVCTVGRSCFRRSFVNEHAVNQRRSGCPDEATIATIAGCQKLNEHE